MNHRLHLRFEQLEQATERLLATAESLGAQAHQPPGPGQWSAAQVVQHLLAAETGIGHYLEKQLQHTEALQQAGLAHTLKAGLLRLLLRLPFTRFKAPARLAELTPAHVAPLPELRAEWASVRRRLEQTLNEYPGPLLRRAIFKHPRSGMLTIEQTLNFMLDHVLHHQHQLERIRKTLSRSS